MTTVHQQHDPSDSEEDEEEEEKKKKKTAVMMMKENETEESIRCDNNNMNNDNTNADAANDTVPLSALRIACLEPSATAICLELGLGPYIVGVTHECADFLPDCADWTTTPPPLVLTRSNLTADASQLEIHRAVQHAAAAAAAATASFTPSCPIGTKPNHAIDSVPSTYPLLEENIYAANPTIIFTQDLCDVCAPTTADVRRCLLKQQNKKKKDTTTTASTNSGKNGKAGLHGVVAESEERTEEDTDFKEEEVLIVSLQPTTLLEVTDTFVTIAEACGVPERGDRMKQHFLAQLQLLQTTIVRASAATRRPKLFLLEWLDPVFDSGHWTHQMMDYACVQNAAATITGAPKTTYKAIVIDWQDVVHTDPDVVVIGCCGFDLARNIQDVVAKQQYLCQLRAGRNQRIYASDGNRFIAQPAPFLLQGVALLAQCAYQNEPRVLDAITKLGYETIGWKNVDVMSKSSSQNNNSSEVKNNTDIRERDYSSGPTIPSTILGDIEDIAVTINEKQEGFASVHDSACTQNKITYTDPETGYEVFTKVAHEQRGYCCGNGCRHCPYSHVNVKDTNKGSKIQQPSILYRQQEKDTDTDDNNTIFSIQKNIDCKVLFNSGGKDSFLAIRELVRQYHDDTYPTFGLILLTTFDAATRMIAHQEIHIDAVIKQATHLNVTLVGLPLRRGSGESYTERIRSGLNVIRKLLPHPNTISSLVFGDLHLSSIKEWRDANLSQFDCKLEYPLWEKPYSELMNDLELSTVPCTISGTTCEREVPVGIPFDRNLYERLVSEVDHNNYSRNNACSDTANTKIDAFGEFGEFHSLAAVWKVPRCTALGLQ